MRYLGSVAGLLYVETPDGAVHVLTTDGRPGRPVVNVQAEALGLRRHAAFKRRQGDEQGADEWAIVAEALQTV